MHNDIARILIPADAIQRRVAEMGGQLTDHFRGRDPLVIAIMNGCVLFLADLLRQMPIHLDLEFVYCKSYQGACRGDLEFGLRSTLPEVVRGRHVLLVDDIFDTGATLAHVVDQLHGLRAAAVTTAVLLAKQGRAAPGVRPPDFAGFTIENLFAVGYGLDYNGRYRNLPFIGELRGDLLAPQRPRSLGE